MVSGAAQQVVRTYSFPPSLHTDTRRLKVPSVNEKGETNITGNYHSSEDIKDRIKYTTKNKLNKKGCSKWGQRFRVIMISIWENTGEMKVRL